MAKTNYSNMSKPKAENPTPKKVEEPKVEDTTLEPTSTELIAKNESASKVNNRVKAIVHNCKKLNVRFGPDKEHDVDFVINVGTKVDVIKDESTDDWYFITCSKGNGYCMKEYIKIKS